MRAPLSWLLLPAGGTTALWSRSSAKLSAMYGDSSLI